MLRRYPYWGWLLFSLLLWCMSAVLFHSHRQAILPERMARAVNNDLRQREAVFESFIKDEDLLRHLFTDSLSDKECSSLANLPFFVFAYNTDTLKFWNTNTVIAPNTDSALEQDIILRTDKGVFVEKCISPSFLDSHKRVVILLPILTTYPLENSYLRSHFAAADYIPVKTKIIAPGDPANGDYPVSYKDGKTIFYLHFNTQDIQRWIPGSLLIFVLIIAAFASVSWIQLMILYLTRNRSPFWGFIITFFTIILLRSLIYKYGLPCNLDTLTFFSPQLYASSKYLSSFGDLFINTLCVLWLVIFITRHTPYKSYFKRITSPPARYLLSVVLVSLLIGYVFFFIKITKSLVLDSSISFDVSHFYSTDLYSILGLFVISTIAGISTLIIYLFNIQLCALVDRRAIKYLLVAAAGIFSVFISGNSNDLFYWLLMGWLLLFIILLDIPKLSLVSDIFAPRMIFWAVFICVFSTGILAYFNRVKELETRIAFVKKELFPQRDFEMESSSFDKTVRNIQKDTVLKRFLLGPSAAVRKIITQRFSTQYLSGASLNKYQPGVYLFDAQGRSLYNKDTVSYNTQISEINESEATNSPYLFYKENIHDRHYYYSYIPVYGDSVKKIIGYVVIDLDLKKTIAQTVHRELLKPTNAADNDYAYAVYINHKLVSQNNDYPFTTDLKNDTLKKDQDFAFYTHNDTRELYYKIADKRTIVVVHIHNQVMEIITLFSYLFVIQVILAIIILCYQLYIYSLTRKLSSLKFIQLTLSRRIHFSMLAVVVLSFVIIGFVITWFYINQYSSGNELKLQSEMLAAKQAVQDELKKHQAYEPGTFDSVCVSNSFKDYITTLANGQIDVNIFDVNGTLLSTSQEDIYEKALVSRKMNPAAYYRLNLEGKSIAIQDEQIAGLSYLSAYQPLRNEHGATLGYINVPFFSSQKDLNFHISNIVVTLIDLYAIIFLISSLGAIFITRWITSTLNIIIQHFGKLNLQRNERISWPYDDAIGVLVSEYNNMVNKLEENAARLAQSEREGAWREMAQQVAHEIKNPLTPMKLNIQYLQQAMKNDQPGIKELTDKVANSIVEQIDNLSYIASEFSNFAKMPEARPAEVELGELLNSAVELYLNEPRIKMTLNKYPETLFVLCDRSQLLRVFNNLFENAKQAIPENRTGTIEVSLVKEDNNALIKITDNGAGITEEGMKKMFQSYFTTKSSGTGLGLAMTKKIIEFWKGAIWFETVEGVGTTFYIRLPLI